MILEDAFKAKVEYTETNDFLGMLPPDLRTPARTWGRGAKLPLRAHLCICMFLRRGRF